VLWWRLGWRVGWRCNWWGPDVVVSCIVSHSIFVRREFVTFCGPFHFRPDTETATKNSDSHSSLRVSPSSAPHMNGSHVMGTETGGMELSL
jgi:hypothetical protein